jgi:hypothetical protein
MFQFNNLTLSVHDGQIMVCTGAAIREDEDGAWELYVGGKCRSIHPSIADAVEAAAYLHTKGASK